MTLQRWGGCREDYKKKEEKKEKKSQDPNKARCGLGKEH